MARMGRVLPGGCARTTGHVRSWAAWRRTWSQPFAVPIPGKGLGASSRPGAHALSLDRIFDDLQQGLLNAFGRRLDHPPRPSDHLRKRGAVRHDDGDSARHGLERGESEPFESARLAHCRRPSDKAGKLFVGGIDEPEDPARVTRNLGKGLPTKLLPVEVTRRVRSHDNEDVGKAAISHPQQCFTHRVEVFPRTDGAREDQIRTIIAGAFSNERPSLGGATGMEQLLVHAEWVYVNPIGCKPVGANELLLGSVSTCDDLRCPGHGLLCGT